MEKQKIKIISLFKMLKLSGYKSVTAREKRERERERERNSMTINITDKSELFFGS